MDFGTKPVTQIPLSIDSYRRQLDAFLNKMGLRMESLEYYAVIRGSKDEIIAGGGFDGRVIKCIAADPDYQGMGLINTIVTHLRSELWGRGVTSPFLFTKPENREIFESLAFTLIGAAPRAVLLEGDSRGIENMQKRLAALRKEGKTGAIVMNCNPFTKGHLYLIEKAAAACDNLVIFPVRADRSVFPYEDRVELISRGTAHLPNVLLADGEDYIISDATFPTYFLKELSEAAATHALLDIDIFARHIAPPLNITARFAGEEPTDPLTAQYNKAMLELLPPRGISVTVIPRLEGGGAPVSASAVRRLLAAGDMEGVRALVPETTYKYLCSEKGQAVAEKLRRGK